MDGFGTFTCFLVLADFLLCLFVVAAGGFGWFDLGYFGFLVSFAYLICLCCALVGLVLVAWIRCFLGYMGVLFGFDVVLVVGLLRLVLIGFAFGL